MTTCYGYTRVSTAKQGEGVSLEAQKDEITRYADKNGLTISDWFEEKETAAKTGRPIFDDMLRKLKSGKADGFIVHKIDRSARNFRDWARISDLSDQGIGVHFATETLDFRSRGGRLTADIQAVIAADFIRNLRDETLKGIKGRLKQGLYPHRAPLGYLDQGRGKVKIPDPARASLVKEMFELYATGKYSFRSLVIEMAARGLKNASGGKLSRSCIENLLNNTFYTGLITIRRTGETYEGLHDPIFPMSLYKRVQDVKSGRYGNKTTRHMHTYKGLFNCAICKNLLTGEKQKGRVYYRCHTRGCPSGTLREDRIDDLLLVLLERSSIEETHFDRLTEDIQSWYEKTQKQSDGTQVIDLRLGKIRTRLEKLTDILVDGVIDQDTYLSRKSAFLQEQMILQEKRRDMEKRGSDLATLLKFFELVKNLTRLYQNANAPEKRLLLELATSNRLICTENLVLQPSEWLLTAQNVMAVPLCYPSQANLRTSTQVQERQLESLFGPLMEPTLTDLVAQMKAIMDKCSGFKC